MKVKELATNSPVIRAIDVKTGKIVGTFQGVRYASRELGLDKSGSGISKVLKGQRKTHGGYRFEYVGESENIYGSELRMSDWQYNKNLKQAKFLNNEPTIISYRAVAGTDTKKRISLLRELQGRANKQITTIKNKGLDSPILHRVKNGKFDFSYDDEDYLYYIDRLSDFLKSEYATVEGAREWTIKQVRDLLGVEVDDDFRLTKDIKNELTRFWEIYHKLRDEGILDSIYGEGEEKYKETLKMRVEDFKNATWNRGKRLVDMTDEDIDEIIRDMEKASKTPYDFGSNLF